MKKLLTLLFLIISITAFSQTPQKYYLKTGGVYIGTYGIDSLYKSNDSVFARRNGVFYFQYIDAASDTTSLSNRINERVKYTDTAAMLSPYIKAVDTLSLSNRINQKIDSLYKNGDSVFARKNGVFIFQYLDPAIDTTSLSNRINEKIDSLYKSGDSVYARKNGTFVFQYIDPAIDTTSLSNRINQKLNTSDTASMLAPYYRAADTVNLRRVKYIGLTMPSAFNVTGSPIIDSGTIAVSGAGTASQYVRGDGVLANFPSVGSGGGGTVYYLNGNTYQRQINGDSLFQMSAIVGGGAGRVFQRSGTGLLASFITDSLKPNQTILPAGVWLFNLYLQELGGGNNKAQIRVKLSKWNGTTLTVIDSSQVEEISNGSIKDLYTLSISLNQNYSLNATDRIVLQFYITNNASNKTILFYTEDNNIASVITTFPSGISSINGLSVNTQYFATGTSGSDFNISSSVDTHTFNLPTASATNRGALSSADWTTFNGKLNPSDTISLSNRINTKLNISDTSAMLSPYMRSNTANASFVTSVFRKTASDSVFFVRGGTNNFAFRDSLGAAGNNIYNTDGTLTGNRTVTMGSNTLSFTGDLTVNGLTVGKGRSSIVSNTALGVSALVGNSGAITGTHNVMLGNEAGFNLTSGNDNVGVGSQALRANQSGIRNVAIGRNALNLNTAGGNVAVGYNTLSNNVNGDHNVAIGNSALNATTGTLNVGIGYFAGVYNTTGSSQIFLNSLNRTNYSGDQNNSPFYAQQNTTVSNQVVTLNGRIGINTTSPSSSAGLEISSVTQGFLPPRMSNTQMGNISTPSTGLTIFNTTDSAIYVRRGTGAGWQQVANEIVNTASLNFPSTNAQNSSDLTITLTGAVDGDAVVLGVPNAAVNANSCYTAWVSASGVVTVRLNNYGTTAIDPAQATFKVTIIK